jgi:predicted Zn-dependent protease
MYIGCKKLLFAAGILALLSMPVQVSAFELSGSKWPTGEMEFYVDIAGTAASGITWNTAFISAMDDWNQQTSFNFILRPEYRNPCTNDGLSSVDFGDDLCGSSFGDSTLAVTVRQFRSAMLGEPAISEANIIINQSKGFNVYDGNLVQSGIQGVDFRRVALHELGHAIGIDHETRNAAIMAPSIGNLDRLQADDIAAAEKLYDGTINCAVSDLAFGAIDNALDLSDCTVSELLPGSSDTSPVDLYRFSLSSSSLIHVDMTSPTLDSVLLIADEDFQVVSVDKKAGSECNSSLTQLLPPGTYYLLANTFDKPVKSACGISGDYRINAVLSSADLNVLGSALSLSGAVVKADFGGGITSTGGVNYSNRFTLNDYLAIVARIEVDPQHIGEAGFLVIAAVIDQQILFLNEQGKFIDSVTNPGVITRASNRTLAAVQEITVIDNLLPRSLGIISEAQVSFYFGYGLRANSQELFYHQAPLRMTISL